MSLDTTLDQGNKEIALVCDPVYCLYVTIQGLVTFTYCFCSVRVDPQETGELLEEALTAEGHHPVPAQRELQRVTNVALQTPQAITFGFSCLPFSRKLYCKCPGAGIASTSTHSTVALQFSNRNAHTAQRNQLASKYVHAGYNVLIPQAEQP